MSSGRELEKVVRHFWHISGANSMPAAALSLFMACKYMSGQGVYERCVFEPRKL